ncbi:MAG: hypothetical protein IJT73_05525 [Selenomonadaceae bacterium]|nr:hypothetical protein [Selenomonadaceae bacterium]
MSMTDEILRHFTQKIPCVKLLGAQPYSLDAGINLTPQMQKLLPTFADKALEILKSWQVKFYGND